MKDYLWNMESPPPKRGTEIRMELLREVRRRAPSGIWSLNSTPSPGGRMWTLNWYYEGADPLVSIGATREKVEDILSNQWEVTRIRKDNYCQEADWARVILRPDGDGEEDEHLVCLPHG